jgi:hypothetical protein
MRNESWSKSKAASPEPRPHSALPGPAPTTRQRSGARRPKPQPGQHRLRHRRLGCRAAPKRATREADVEPDVAAALRDRSTPGQSAGYRAFQREPRVEESRQPRDRSAQAPRVARREDAHGHGRHQRHHPQAQARALKRRRQSSCALALVAESLGSECESERASRSTPRPVENLLKGLLLSLAGELGEQILLHRLTCSGCSPAQHPVHLERDVLDLDTGHCISVAPNWRYLMYFGVSRSGVDPGMKGSVDRPIDACATPSTRLQTARSATRHSPEKSQMFGSRSQDESGAARTRTWNRRFWRPVP